MTRVEQAFAAAEEEGRATFVAYLTAFDPDADRSLALLRAAAEAGADVLEVGVPFSDPTADGPAIQAAMARARAAGATLPRVLDLVARLRAHTSVPCVLFSYANPLLRLGEALAPRLADAGIDAVLALDVSVFDVPAVFGARAAADLAWVGLCGPRTPDARARAIARRARGFVYQIARTGVTGAGGGRDGDLAHRVAVLRAAGPRPVAVGFGVRRREDAAAVAAIADGVVVGSHLVQRAAAAFAAGEDGAEAVAEAVADLRAGLSRPPARSRRA